MTTPAAAGSGGSPKGLGALHNIELTSTENVYTYANTAAKIMRALAMEVEAAASQLTTNLIRGFASSNSQFDQLQQRRLARRCTRSARKAAAHVAAGERDMARFWVDYNTMWDSMIRPAKNKKGFEFKGEVPANLHAARHAG